MWVVETKRWCMHGTPHANDDVTGFQAWQRMVANAIGREKKKIRKIQEQEFLTSNPSKSIPQGFGGWNHSTPLLPNKEGTQRFALQKLIFCSHNNIQSARVNIYKWSSNSLPSGRKWYPGNDTQSWPNKSNPRKVRVHLYLHFIYFTHPLYHSFAGPHHFTTPRHFIMANWIHRTLPHKIKHATLSN